MPFTIRKTFASLAALAVTAALQTSHAQLTVPSDGSDGALNVTTSTSIDLSGAPAAAWNANNTAHVGKGVYDAAKWAVVFKYSSVKIGNGATISFANHPSHAPVVWLVSGDVTINGTLSLDGSPGAASVPGEYTPAEPGPGGFRGGAYGPLGFGAGYGPAGGSGGQGGTGGYAAAYGNPQILPLIGGSGGGSWNDNIPGSGSGGGGAILIVAAGTVTINGAVTAHSARSNGVRDNSNTFPYTFGASGAIRIVANQILGSGTIDASGFSPAPSTVGRTRMEANTISPQLSIFPSTAAVSPGTTPIIWPPDNAPTVTIVSVDSQPAPADPLAGVATSSDIAVQNNKPVHIVLETKNLPIQGAVSLRITPKYADATTVNAAFVSGDINTATWQATATLPQGFCTLQARATAP